MILEATLMTMINLHQFQDTETIVEDSTFFLESKALWLDWIAILVLKEAECRAPV